MEKVDPMDVVVRRGTLEDVEGLRRCLDYVARERRWLAFLEAPPLESVRAFFLQNSPIQFVADHRAGIVGWCDITPSQRDGFRHSGTLGMGLLPAFRSRGFGKRLLQETIDAAHEVGLTRIELEVLASNEAAIALYERMGFGHEGRKQQARLIDGRSDDLICMALVASPM